MKLIPIIWFILLLSLRVFGQDAGVFTIRGKVTEENGKPLPFATIALTCFPDIDVIVKGVVSDREGCFELTAPKGEYLMIVRNLGFKNFTKKLAPDMGNLIDLGDIQLKVQSELLDMVTVKPLVEIKVDQITYNLMADPDRETSSLHAILDKVPLIERTPMGDLYVDQPGKKFLVVRNGKKDALFEGKINDLLKAIPAKGFATVTVMLAPPEHYGDYDYIVDITTDKSTRLYGAVGLVEAEGNFASGSVKPEATVMASLNKVRLNLGGSFENQNQPKSTSSVRQKSVADGSVSIQEQEIQRSGENWKTGVMLSSDLGKKHFANWRLGYGEEFSRNKSITAVRAGIQAEPDMSDFIQREEKKLWSGGVEYQYDITGNKQVLNVAYQLNAFPGRRCDYAADTLYESADEKQHEQAFQVHYYGALPKGLRIEAGTGYIYRYYFQDISRSSTLYNRLEENKHIVNAYGRLGISKKTISASVGLKIDYLNDGDGSLLVVDGQSERISSTGIHFMPDARFLLSLPRCLFSRFNMEYQLSHYRPSLKMLSVYEDHSNPNFIVTGNPELKEETTHHLRLQTNMKQWQFMFNWIYTDDNIGSYWLKDAQERIIQTYANQGFSSSYHFGVNRSVLIKKWMLLFNATTSYGYTRMAQREKEEKWSVHISSNISYTFPKEWTLGMNIGYIDNFSKGYSSYQLSPFSLALRVRKQFFKGRGELEVFYHNLVRYNFNTERKVNTETFVMEQKTNRRYIPLSVNFKLRIGSYKVKPAKKIRKGIIIDDVATE